MFVFENLQLTHPRYIINFPTKRHWRDKSRLEDIKAGLADLMLVIQEKKIRSIAIPPLGCGFGGLNWTEVEPLIISALEIVPEVQAWIYPPTGTPMPEKMPVSTERPRLTQGRAALIELVSQYALPGYRLTQLEIQKLSYFLQMAGEPLKLNFVKQQYGPYAENLHFVLQRLEGHYLRGYGARAGGSNLYLLPGAKEEAEAFLANQPETLEHLQRVSRLIQGFETPYGMELLATVQWLAQEDPSIKSDYLAAIKGFASWNERKAKHFRPEHIQIAWERLRQQGWL
jgi:O-acetyl-ADP-ribose deacetylase (regulator of RNase III)